MRRILLSLLAIILLGFLGYTIYQLKTQPSTQTLQGIDILLLNSKGVEPFMGEEDVRQEMVRKGLNLKGTPLEKIDVGAVERSLRGNPLFSDVEVYIASGTARMKVEVTQKEAFFLVQNNEGKSYYVSNERGIIPLNPQYAVYVPVVTGAVSQEMACDSIYNLMECLRSDDYFCNYFGQIHVDSKEGVILSPRIGNTPVILGFNQDYKTMLHKYKVFCQEVLPRTGDNAYAYIKLGYKDQVVARPRSWTPEVTDTLTTN